jgi:hypothetical protein
MVGYAQPSVRPTQEVYLINPITYMNGGDIGYKFATGPMLYKVSAAAGNLNQTITSTAGTFTYKFENKLINGSAEYNGSTLRLGYGRIKLTAKADVLDVYDAGMNTLVNNGVANASDLQSAVNHTDNPVDFYDLGYVYDKNEWLIQAEYASRKSKSDFVSDQDGISLLGGYRIGKWTPYLSYGHLSHKSAINLPQVALNVPPLTPLQAGSIKALNSNFMLHNSRTTWALGTRWDVIDNVALKVQAERIDKEAGGPAFFVNGTPEFTNNNRNINVYSATLDFVF